jgi:hypothetical protein
MLYYSMKRPFCQEINGEFGCENRKIGYNDGSGRRKRPPAAKPGLN